MEDADLTRRAVHGALRGRISELPPVPTAALKLLRLTGAEAAADAAAVARVIETEPALATKVLRIVNSAYYGFSRRVDSIQRAVTLLGFAAIRRVALHLLFFDGLISRVGGGDFDRLFFWQHSLMVAILSRLLAERLRHPEPDAVYAAGLLHDLGKIMLETHGRVRYSALLEATRHSANPVLEDERRFFGASHDEVGAVISRDWDLPALICQVQSLHHRETAADLDGAEALGVAIVSLADFIAWTQGLGSVASHGPPLLPPTAARLVSRPGLDLAPLLERADAEIRDVGAFYGLSFPSATQLRVSLLATAIQLGQGGEGGARLQASLTAPHHSLEPDELIPLTLEALHTELRIGQLLMMRVEPRHRRLLVSHTWPARPATASPRPSLTISGLAPELVNCLRSRRPVRVPYSESSAALLELLDSPAADVVPVLSNGRLQGLLWLSAGHPDQAPDQALLAEVQRVADELGIALEHSRRYRLEKTKADLDALTRLHNRGAIDRHLASLSQSGGDRRTVLCLLDIDRFKSFNDTFGHQAGDDVLRVVADTLRDLSRPGDFLGRYGGEEFLMVLAETDAQGATVYAERIRAALQQRGELLARRFPGHPLTASIGLALHPDGHGDWTRSLSAADQALYRAKEQGRNRVVAAWELALTET
jgi:two-component system cell cycle response regulator